MSRFALLGAALAAAVAIVGIAIAVSSGGGGNGSGAGGPVSGASATQRLFAGIPERGTELGRGNAPVTLVRVSGLGFSLPMGHGSVT